MAMACLSLWKHGQLSKFPRDPTLPVEFIAQCHLLFKIFFLEFCGRLAETFNCW